MNAPPVQYARTSDGVNIAYCCLGTGPPVVFASNVYGDAYFYRCGWPYVRRPVDQMVNGGWSVVLYDVRGMGASDQPVERLDIDSRVDDLEAVVRATGLQRFILAASDLAGVTAIAYAARHPGSVSRLLLIEPWASGAKKYALAPMRLASLMNPALGDGWTVWANVLGSIVTGFQDHRLGQQLADAIQESTTPAQLAAYLRANREMDVTDLLESVSAPALVAHYPDAAIGSLELARDVASRLPDARFLVKESSLAWPDIEGFLRQEPIGTERPQSQDSGLSARELEVLSLLAAGRSNQQIADELVISLNTVRRHVSNIFDKTGAANRAQAAVYARDHGLA